MSKKLHLNTIQTIELHISFQLYQKYLFGSTILFTQYILTPVNPLNTIYQIIYFNILLVCWLLVYTCKPLPYTKKLKERCYFHSVQQSYENNSCKPEIKYFTVVNHSCKLPVYSCKPLVYSRLQQDKFR